jgi:hypothetical protein
VTLFDQAHLDQSFADTFWFGCRLALNLARCPDVIIRNQATSDKNVADADSASGSANEIVEPGSADPVHLQQDVAEGFFAIQVLGDLARLGKLVFCEQTFVD